MKVVYNKESYDIILIVDDSSVVRTSKMNDVFYGTEEQFNGFIRVQKDKVKGQEIIDRFLAENKLLDISLEQNINLLNKFMPVKGLLELGDITSAHALTIGLEVDEIFTEERKQFYLLEMAKYLNYI